VKLSRVEKERKNGEEVKVMDDETTQVALTVTLATLSLAGLVVSVFWVYVTKLALSDERLTNQTFTVISTIGHIFIANLVKSVFSLTAGLCWIWLYYNGEKSQVGYVLCYWLITLFIVLESAQLTLIAINRLNSSRKLYWKWSRHLPWFVLAISALLASASALLEWFITPSPAALFTSTIVFLTYCVFIFISAQTHKNIGNRFGKGQTKRGSTILALSSLAFLLQIAPFIVLSFVAYFNAEEGGGDVYLLVGVIVSHSSSIYNGFLYGLTNQRFQPSYQATVTCKKSTAASAENNVTGMTNEAFTDDVL